MKEYYDQGHREVQYNIGDLVWLCLQHYRQSSMAGSRHKLSPKYFGPFVISQRVGEVAYKLHLPSDARIHDVFHVSFLKQFKGSYPPIPSSLPPMEEGRLSFMPTQILDAQQNPHRREVLVQWAHLDTSNATWEDIDVFQQAYPTFEIADILVFKGGSDVVD
ncbi:uncharacterized protein [Aristolochia californica]|uniref:uncharacterized protein n=1 Tax=Aristolochia californica TaxID=171875 RepID=UPI0035E2C6B0